MQRGNARAANSLGMTSHQQPKESEIDLYIDGLLSWRFCKFRGIYVIHPIYRSNYSVYNSQQTPTALRIRIEQGIDIYPGEHEEWLKKAWR